MHKNVVIIGAPRSGTNMLRDMLVKLDKVETWPCDEINYIWRHGNVRFSSDQLTPKEARGSVKKYIRGQFDKFQEKSNADVVIEKTCASSLRVDFINEILPEAKYIYIVRDGVDCVGSAKLRWTATLDIPYLIKKAKYVPWNDLPYYGLKYLGNRAFRMFSNEKRLAYWGPSLPNMESIVMSNSLMQVCALQWQACVNKALLDLAKIEPKNVLNIRYEKFVMNPVEEFNKVAKFIGKKPSHEDIKYVKSRVSAKNIGKGRVAISKDEYDSILPLIYKDLERLGYETR